jgi:hypothetical protein
MTHASWRLLFLAIVTPAAPGAAAEFSIKTVAAPPPKELPEATVKLLGEQSVQLLDASGSVVARLWFRKELPAKATPEQVKNGLTYRELQETALLGAVRFEQGVTDYRKQKIKPGVYTLRLGFQPMDGDHMGTAPYPEFGLLIPAVDDTKPDVMTAKELQELSAKASGGSHPAVFLLYPNEKPADAPQLVDKGGGTWVLNVKEPVVAGGQKAAIGMGLTLVGHTEQ